MTVRIDLDGFDAASPSRRLRALRELSELARALPPGQFEVTAVGEAAFAARLMLAPEVTVMRPVVRAGGNVVFRPFGEPAPSAVSGRPMLVEPRDLGPVVDGAEGPGASREIRHARLRALAEAPSVHWRIGAEWQADVLAERFGVASTHLWRRPATAGVPAPARLSEILLPPGLAAGHLLCLTPVGPAGDLPLLIAAYGRLGAGWPPLVILGVDDPAWEPLIRQASARAGTAGRVFVLRDLDPLGEIAAIARADAVLAADRHPVHAVRLRQAAALGRPLVIREHPGHRAWVSGGRWYCDDVDSIAGAIGDAMPGTVRPPDRTESWGSLLSLGEGRGAEGA